MNFGRTLFSQVMDFVPGQVLTGSSHGMAAMFGFAAFVAVNSFA